MERLSGLDIDKSPGYIDTPAIIITESKFLVSHYLATSFNKSAETGSYSDVLKVAKVVPLQKADTKWT